MNCASCGEKLIQAGRGSGYCVACGAPFTISDDGVQEFDGAGLDNLAEAVAGRLDLEGRITRLMDDRQTAPPTPPAPVVEQEGGENGGRGESRHPWDDD